MNLRHTSRPLGVTLLELLIVLSVIGIVTAMAYTRVRAASEQFGLETAAQQLRGDLNLARVQAIRTNQAVTLARTGTSSYRIQTAVRSFPDGVSFVAGAPDSVRFASFGPPMIGGANFQLQAGSRQKTVRLSVAGYASF